MDPLLKKLTRLRGVGVVLATRFKDSGLDTFEKIAAVGEEGLSKVRGINLRAVPAILVQAAELAAEEAGRVIDQAADKATSLSARVQDVTRNVRDRFGDELQGKTGKKIEKEIFKIIDYLDSTSLKRSKKKVAKGIAKAEKRLAMAEKASLKKIRKCLKRTRKSLAKISSRR
jgi:hypothetical protein